MDIIIKIQPKLKYVTHNLKKFFSELCKLVQSNNSKKNDTVKQTIQTYERKNWSIQPHAMLQNQ